MARLRVLGHGCQMARLGSQMGSQGLRNRVNQSYLANIRGPEDNNGGFPRESDTTSKEKDPWARSFSLEISYTGASGPVYSLNLTGSGCFL